MYTHNTFSIKQSYHIVLFTTSEGTRIAFPLLSIETKVKKASTAFIAASATSPDCLLKIDSYSTITSISIDLLLVNVSSPRTVTSEPEYNTYITPVNKQIWSHTHSHAILRLFCQVHMGVLVVSQRTNLVEQPLEFLSQMSNV